jgi:hypothetical protein
MEPMKLFCRLLKGAELVVLEKPVEETPEDDGPEEQPLI